MRFERTYDQQYIKDCLIQNWARTAGEYADQIHPKLFFPPISDDYYWLKCGDAGVVMGIEVEPGAWDCHAALIQARGQGKRIAIDAMKWFCANHENFRRFQVTIDLKNVIIQTFLKRLSFKVHLIKNNKITLIINKEDLCRQSQQSV